MTLSLDNGYYLLAPMNTVTYIKICTRIYELDKIYHQGGSERFFYNNMLIEFDNLNKGKTFVTKNICVFIASLTYDKAYKPPVAEVNRLVKPFIEKLSNKH
jgi:hypothetical protein